GKGTVRLKLEGEDKARDWPLTPEAEVKVQGWWGRLDQLVPGDRVYAWFLTDREKRPTAVFMLADEVSQQDIHGGPLTVPAAAGSVMRLQTSRGERLLGTADAAFFRGQEKVRPGDLETGEKVFVQSAGDKARLILDAAAFEKRRGEQQAWLRKRWADDGLPGTVGFVHVYSGEADLLLDHEAMRWGRSLKTGDKVTLATKPPIEAVVKSVAPWREHTQVRLVAKGAELTALRTGSRVSLRMPAPPPSVDTDVYPPDIGRPRTKAERVEW